VVVGLVATIVTLSACTSNNSSPASDAAVKGNADLQNQVYVQKNNVEFQNYNDRQKVADDPATILWCTAYPSNPNARPTTYPIKGKLTSSEKRPFPTQVVEYGGNGGRYTPELPGPDKMLGASVPYRYGFTPAGVYVDFTGLETTCTTQPTVYQKNSTDIVLKQDPTLTDASAKAKAALENKDPAKATKILEDAIGGK
jgi:hypothetical protein